MRAIDGSRPGPRPHLLAALAAAATPLRPGHLYARHTKWPIRSFLFELIACTAAARVLHRYMTLFGVVRRYFTAGVVRPRYTTTTWRGQRVKPLWGCSNAGTCAKSGAKKEALSPGMRCEQQCSARGAARTLDLQEHDLMFLRV